MTSVLVVDDERCLVDALAALLELAGYEVRTARNGRDALAAIEGAAPDFIVTDWMMPEMDGVALIERLREDPTLRTIPVVMMSAAPDAARLRGVSGVPVLRKPFDIEALLGTLRRIDADEPQ